MNYRHAFHAGNFADVHKHAVLARILVRLKEKPAALRVIDTHAGAGLYDLAGAEAERTGEWRDGIGRLIAATLTSNVRALLEPYLDAVANVDPSGGQRLYPGSPLLARALMRPQDRLTACELEPTAARALIGALGRDRQAKVETIDGWTALSAYVPPRERRGVVVIDPPFEREDEFEHLPARLSAAHKKWTTGIYLLWYPIKDRREPDRLARALAQAGIRRILRSEIMVGPMAETTGLNGSGLILVNPPFRLQDELALLGPALAGILARAENPGCARLDWIAGE